MTVTVVIPTRGNPALVVDTVASILAGTRLPDELVVVDQTNPPDPRVLRLAAEHPSVRIVGSTSAGAGRARNEGITASTGELVVVTDDDVLMDPAWLEHMVAALVRSGDRIVVTGRVLSGPPEVDGGIALSLATDEEPAVFQGQLRRDPLNGNSWAAHRSAFAEIGLFDERLGPGGRYASADDNDFGYRLLKAGYAIHYVPEAVLYHRARRSGRQLAKVNWWYGRGQGAFIAKHALAGDRWMRGRLFSTTRWWAKRLATRPLRQRRPGGHGDLRYLTAFFSAVGEWWLREHFLRRTRRLVDRVSRAVVPEAKRPVYRSPVTGGRPAIALTFDDGPSEWTPAILDLLRAADARATFFVVGEAIDGREEILRRVVEEGHEIGNHTRHHFDPTTLDDATLRDELVWTADRIRVAAGVVPTSVRPPYCADPWRVARIAFDAGCGRTVLRSVDPADWRNPDAALVAREVVDQAEPGAIVCLHDGVPRANRGVTTRQHTVEAVALILSALAERGFEFVTVSTLLA